MQASQECWFDHEKLVVYQEAVAFIAWLSPLLETTLRIGDVKDQLDRASTSIPLNIAEGNGKYTPKDRCRFAAVAAAAADADAAAEEVAPAAGPILLQPAAAAAADAVAPEPGDVPCQQPPRRCWIR
jgi:hypothetical protein